MKYKPGCALPQRRGRLLGPPTYKSRCRAVPSPSGTVSQNGAIVSSARPSLAQDVLSPKSFRHSFLLAPLHRFCWRWCTAIIMPKLTLAARFRVTCTGLAYSSYWPDMSARLAFARTIPSSLLTYGSIDLRLKPNAHDSNGTRRARAIHALVLFRSRVPPLAVEVWVQGAADKLGFVARSDAPTVARLIREGYTLEARITHASVSVCTPFFPRPL